MFKRLFAALLVVTLAACSTLGLKKPEVSLSDIKPAGKSTLFEQNFDVALRVSNPNAFALSGRGMNFTLFVNGDKLADGASNQAFEVPANGSAVVTLRMRTSLADWLRQAGSLLTSGGGVDYRLQGRINDVNGLADLPIDRSGRWSLTR